MPAAAAIAGRQFFDFRQLNISELGNDKLCNPLAMRNPMHVAVAEDIHRDEQLATIIAVDRPENDVHASGAQTRAGTNGRVKSLGKLNGDSCWYELRLG